MESQGTFMNPLDLTQTTDDTRCYIPKRYILTLLGFLGMFNVYAMRVNLSVAMVAMVNSTEAPSSGLNRSAEVVECAMLVEPEQNSTKRLFKGEQYHWDSEVQGLVLGAFFYGYIITQVPGGFLAEKLGAKWLFGGGVLVTSILTLLTPFAASRGTAAFVVVRVLEGIGEGVTFPSMNVLISQWAPVLERSRLSTIIFMGAQMGNVVSMPVSGLLSSSDLLGGWPSAFYVFGTIGCIWFVLWAFLVHESPSAHPTISTAELALFRQPEDNLCKKKKLSFRWKAIFTSRAMWATLAAHFGHNLGFLVYLTELPNYLSSILHFNIAEDGALSALPYVMQVLSACLASVIADKLRSSGVLSITWIRKILNTIGMVGPAICLLVVTACGCRQQLTVAMLTLAMALNGFVYSGFHITHVDMCPELAGTLYGMTNTLANSCGIIAPALVGTFTEDGATIPNWNKVFYITSSVYMAGAILFFSLASAEKQAWISSQDHKPSKSNVQ